MRRPNTVLPITNEYAITSTPTITSTIGVPPELRDSTNVRAPMATATSAFLLTNASSDSTCRPCLRLASRDRSCVNTTAAMPTKPSSNVRASRFPAKPSTLGSDPLEMRT